MQSCTPNSDDGSHGDGYKSPEIIQPPKEHAGDIHMLVILQPDLIRYPHNLHPLSYLISLYEAYHQASIWHNQIHLTSRRQLERDYPGRYDEEIKTHWRALKFAEHRDWKNAGRAKLKELDRKVLEDEENIQHIRRSNVTRQKFERLLRERMERDWRRNYDLLLYGPVGVAGNALATLRRNGAPLISLDYLWDLLEDPTCDPPKDCLYYYPGQRLTRGNAHYREPSLPTKPPPPLLLDLPRYGKPLPVALSAKDTDKQRILARKQALESRDIYAQSMGHPGEPIIPGETSIHAPPQLDGSMESRLYSHSYDVDSSSIVQRMLRQPEQRREGLLVISFPESGLEEDQAVHDLGVEFLARLLQNPKYFLQLIDLVDQEDRGTLRTEDLIKLIFKVADWSWPPPPGVLEKLADYARAGIDDAKTRSSMREKKSKPGEPKVRFDVAPPAEDEDEVAKITPDSMLEILSKSYVVPVSGYYYNVQEAVFMALVDKTKSVVAHVRPNEGDPSLNSYGVPLDHPQQKAQLVEARKEFNAWLGQLYVGAKLERIRSRRRYENRAKRWKRIWNEVVRDGKDIEEVLSYTKSPGVDRVLVEFIKENPRKRPFPGVPGPRLEFEDEYEECDEIRSTAATSGSSSSQRQSEEDMLGPMTVRVATRRNTNRKKAMVLEHDRKWNSDGAHDEAHSEHRESDNQSQHGPENRSDEEVALEIYEHRQEEHAAALHVDGSYSRAAAPERTSPSGSHMHNCPYHDGDRHWEPYCLHKSILKHSHNGVDSERNPVDAATDGRKESHGNLHVRIVLPPKVPDRTGVTGLE